MISDYKKELISIEVIKTLNSRFESFPLDSSNNSNAPFHEAFLNAFSDKLEGKVSDIPFFISLSSWLHGLNTTLGQSFFENIAHILSNGQKVAFTNTQNNQLKVTNQQKESIAEIITDLKNGNHLPDLSRENSLIFDNNGNEIPANNFTIDVFFSDDDKVVSIELKSVKPNAGEMRGEKQKILEGKAALYRKYTNKQIFYYIGFPFDPTNEAPTGYNKRVFLNSIIDSRKYFDYSEILLADELWNFLSNDTNTMQQILDIINSIATPEFIDKYNSLNNLFSETTIEAKIGILRQWNLISEINLLENNDLIVNSIANDTALKRIYKQNIFKDGNYNWLRHARLIELID